MTQSATRRPDRPHLDHPNQGSSPQTREDSGTLRQWRKSPRTTQVSNDVVDSLKSLAAKGLYLQLRMMPDHARIGCRHLATLFEEGRDKIARCLNQLVEAGVLTRVVWQVGNGQWVTKYLVSDQPFDTDDVLEIAAQYRATYVTVSADLARPLRALGLTYTVNETGKEHVIRVSGFASARMPDPASALVTTGSGFLAPGPDEPVEPLVSTGYGNPSPGEQDPASTGCQKSGSHKVFTYSSSYPSLRDEPPTAAGEGGMDSPTPTTHTADQPAADQVSTEQVPISDEVAEFITEQTAQVMAQVVKTFRAGISAAELRTLEAQVQRLILDGHTPMALTKTLTSNTGGIKMPGRVLLKRLVDLDEINAITQEYHQLEASPVRWCGHCNQTTRLVDHVDTDGKPTVHRCQQCHPDRDTTATPCGHCQPAVDRTVTAGEEPLRRKSRPWKDLLDEVLAEQAGERP